MSGTLFDTNVWLAIVFKKHPFHRAAQQQLEEATSAKPAVFCRSTEQSFLRLITNDRLLKFYEVQSLTNRTATLQLHKLQALPQVHVQDEPRGTTAIWHSIAALNTPSPRIWMDAYLAAFAISGGLRLLTIDKDFKTYERHGLILTLIEAP
jgi:toxin-antitoxin system PIN domain toxin